MIKSVHNRLTTSTISIIFLCMTQSTKCPDYEKVPSHATESTESKTSAVALTPEEVATHNQNATNAVNKLLPPTAKPTVVDKPATQDFMGGGVDLGAPHKALSDDDLNKIQKSGALNTSQDGFATYDKTINDKGIVTSEKYKITSEYGKKTTTFNDKNNPTNVYKQLENGSSVTTELHPETGQKLSTTISTPPVKTGWFSTAKSSTVIQHHDDGTHTATTTTTTSNLFSPLFGDKSEVTAVEKLNNQAETTATFKPGTKTSRGWDGSTTTTTVHADGSTSAQVKSLFGTTISTSGTESNGSQINANAPYNVE